MQKNKGSFTQRLPYPKAQPKLAAPIVIHSVEIDLDLCDSDTAQSNQPAEFPNLNKPGPMKPKGKKQRISERAVQPKDGGLTGRAGIVPQAKISRPVKPTQNTGGVKTEWQEAEDAKGKRGERTTYDRFVINDTLKKEPCSQRIKALGNLERFTTGSSNVKHSEVRKPTVSRLEESTNRTAWSSLLKNPGKSNSLISLSAVKDDTEEDFSRNPILTYSRSSRHTDDLQASDEEIRRAELDRNMRKPLQHEESDDDIERDPEVLEIDSKLLNDSVKSPSESEENSAANSGEESQEVVYNSRGDEIREASDEDESERLSGEAGQSNGERNAHSQDCNSEAEDKVQNEGSQSLDDEQDANSKGHEATNSDRRQLSPRTQLNDVPEESESDKDFQPPRTQESELDSKLLELDRKLLEMELATKLQVLERSHDDGKELLQEIEHKRTESCRYKDVRLEGESVFTIDVKKETLNEQPAVYESYEEFMRKMKDGEFAERNEAVDREVNRVIVGEENEGGGEGKDKVSGSGSKGRYGNRFSKACEYEEDSRGIDNRANKNELQNNALARKEPRTKSTSNEISQEECNNDAVEERKARSYYVVNEKARQANLNSKEAGIEKKQATKRYYNSHIAVESTDNKAKTESITKEKELLVEKRNACVKIQRAYRRFMLNVRRHELYSESLASGYRDHNLKAKVLDGIKKLHEEKKSEVILKKYMNHCASIIQSYYRRYKERTKSIQRARGRKAVGSKDLIAQGAKDSAKEHKGKQRKQKFINERELANSSRRYEDLHKHAKEDLNKDKYYNEPSTKFCEEKPIKAVGEYKYDAETVPVIEEAFKPPANPNVTKKNFLKRKEVYDPLKSIKESKKGHSQGAKSTIEVRRKESSGGPQEAKSGKQEDQSPRTGQSEADDEGRTKRDYLRRRSKKVEARKVDWQGVTRRIDCWNPRQKSPARNTVLRGKRESGKDVRAEDEVQGKVCARLTMKQLGKVYLQYHGDGEGTRFHYFIVIRTYFKRNRDKSVVPVLVWNSRFFKEYNDTEYYVQCHVNS